jgi:signal transduction histidine kinase
MSPASVESEVGGSGTPDLATFNRWKCLTRLYAAGGAILGSCLIHVGIGPLPLGRVFLTCGAAALVSVVGLRWKWLIARQRLCFYAQAFTDVVVISTGIHLAFGGTPSAPLLRPLYTLVIVGASLVSLRSGLVMTAAVVLAHELMLGVDNGFSVATLLGTASISPTLTFFLIAQQCSFYGRHLEAKNKALAGLAARLDESHRRLATEVRVSRGLLDVARTLSTTLEAPELLARVNRATREQLGADWSATFLVDAERNTFRLVAVTNADAAASELGRFELPLRGWSAVERLANEPVIVLDGSDAERALGLFASGQRVSTALLAALYSERTLIGFVAVAYEQVGFGEVESALPVLEGIAQQATVALQNARLLEEVRRASEVKSEFVGAISHDLRSPLNVMLGYAEMLLEGGLGPLNRGQTEAVQRTQQQSLALLEMITAVLDLNRLEAGRLPVDRSVVVVSTLLGEVRAQLPENWRRPGVTFQVGVAPDVPVIETDAAKLKTIVRNLVHNALKFTERGEVRLEADVTPTGMVTISVKDTGCGIQPEAIDYVFDMFRQGPGATGGGVGLGLHIVRRLLELLGGTITVTSEVGRGSCFTVSLPATTASVAPVGATADAA